MAAYVVRILCSGIAELTGLLVLPEKTILIAGYYRDSCGAKL